MNSKIIRKLISVSFICVLIMFLLLIKKYYPSTIVQLFSFPAAKLSSVFLGVPYYRSDELTYTLYHSFATLRIIESCSGYNFWIIFFSFMIFQVINKYSFLRAYMYCALLLPLSYISAIIVNTCRILASFYIRISGSSLVSEKYADVVHLWTGIIIFMSALIFIQILFQRRIKNEA